MAALHSSLAFVALGILAQPADAPPTPEQVRDAVKRSLVHMEKEGVAWMKNTNRQCSSCHQVPMLVWTHNAARKSGFAVDSAKLDVWNQWIVNDALNQNTFYKLTDGSFGKLKQGGLLDGHLTKLQPIKNSNFVLEYEFHDELSKLMTPEVAAQDKDLFQKSAAVPGQGGRGGSASSSGYTAMINAGAMYTPRISDKSRQGLIDGLVKTQAQDGTWKTAGQFFAQKWPAAEANHTHTMWALHALASVEALPEPAAKARDRALAAIRNVKAAPASTETLALQLLTAHQHGDAERSRTLLEQVAKQQHTDGGWGWVTANPGSDAYATGLVLYVLGTVGRKGSDSTVQKACKYLLTTQRSEGDWFVHRKTISAPVKKSDEEGTAVYSYWGSGWAVLGLLRTLPE
ncbi:MAG: terpene cyclase/mutase family protein [Gemmataceae bacterium]|nr:terpene cyclase/mutase family protein [Gemmataceae bacterium]